MQLTLERPDHEFFLRGADGRAALVNDRRIERSFILAPNALIEDWAVTDVRSLRIEDLEPLFALQPELIVLGCGAVQAFPPTATLAASLQRKVGLESMTNAAAARTFNVLAGEGRRVVAGFVLGG
ncbi:Mth938-like domain-containing protein [Lysobacter sp. K5869]|uniref:Mth938-like domain-containing protein n=1 Tax=Lysobacter sp. K5869 TaxID=2820808 RepID=UPI001C061930|nr:Mth938-like domain-containing protein [Lysobacter sp. K5869]QWP76269.1 Mth938-like domain-containing protein [Lysobacter sp. K5869]